MEFRILGPLEVVEDGEPVALGTLKERLVLGVLLLHANEFVSRERLIDDLWGEAPPATARQAINVYVSKLRKTLGRPGADPIATADGGYRLRVEPERLDASRMQALAAEARDLVAQGELESAAGRFQEALSLWRGPTLAGLQLESRGRDEVAQLDELRLAALMDRIDCDLALGRHEQALGELNVLVREHPLRERLRAQQMLALYRADRQADALDAYAEGRRAFVDDLGIEPSEALQRLQQAILRHDASLETPSGMAFIGSEPLTPTTSQTAPSTAVPSPGRRSALSPRWRYLLVAVVVAAAAAAAVTVEVAGGSRRSPTRVGLRIKANSVARIDPTTGRVVSDFSAGIEPGPMALTRDTLWVVSRGDGTVTRYDLRTKKKKDGPGVSSSSYGVAADADGNVWISDRSPLVTWILRSASGAGTSAVPWVTKNVPVPLPRATEEAVGAGDLWVIAGSPALDLRPREDRVSLIDVRSRRFVSSIPISGEPTAVAFGYGSAWIGTYDRRHSSDTLNVVRPGSSHPEPLRLEAGDGAGPLGVATGAGSIWVLTSAGTLFRIDPETLQVLKRITLGAKQPSLLSFGDGSVWTANLADFSVSRIDPDKNRVVKTFPVGSYKKDLCGIEATHRAVWVAIGDSYCDSANR